MAERRILIVEYEHTVAIGIKRMLKGLRYTVTGIASSGEEANKQGRKYFLCCAYGYHVEG
ncbi:hypothetical protein ACSAZL_19810 [Methanosarcina sp. T3]|uniref:hypothetical protein n=1 Tax=Methanosarcina sp. T3 TaxID=3439062 RepID=UPI003F83F8FA